MKHEAHLSEMLLTNTKRWSYFTLRTKAFVPRLTGLTHLNIQVTIALDAPRRPTPPNITLTTKSRLNFLKTQYIWVLKRGMQRVLSIFLYPLTEALGRSLSKKLSHLLLEELSKTQHSALNES